MNLINMAIWAIERRLSGEITLDAIADACGASPSHLAHAFSAATGTSVVAYARARRLSLAAEALANGPDEIFSVALDAGYASHEAFSRAFKSALGATPERVRAAGSTDGLTLTAPLPYVRGAERPPVTPERFVRLPRRLAVGLVERRAHGDVATIPAQWGRFMQVSAEIAYAIDPVPWGVSFGDETGFDYACAVIVSRADDVPEGLRKLDLPACDYAVYRHAGHVSRIAETYAAICGDGPKTDRAIAGPTLEQHAPEFNPHTGLGGVFIYLPAFL